MIKKTVIFLLEIFAFISAYEINLEDNGPIVLDGTIRFTVAVYDENGLVKDNIKFEWEDDAYPQHIRKTDIINNGTDIWEITYNASIYRPRIYIAKVTLLKCFFICYQVGSASIAYNVTESINGHMLLQQNNKTISNGYVSTKEKVIHVLDIYKTDMDFIKTATTIRTYWFVDCTYYGITNELRFPFNFTTANQDHLVEALVMADFTPPPPTTTLPPSTTTSTTAIPNTTTTTTTTTTTKLPVTTKTTTITISPTSTTASIITDLNISSTLPSTTTKSLKKAKRDVEGTTLPHVTGVTIWNNGSLIPYNKSFPFVCNSSFLSTDSHKSYGYFYKKFQTKDPLSKVNITGNNWLQPGDLLSLRISCEGSKNFKYCIQYKKGEYNVTGNETCSDFLTTDKCDFNIRRYLSYPKSTILVIIENDINKEITPVTVNIYKVKKQGQLSVIVVPVAFSLVAVVLIVFGVAYYFQNRSRFIIEVADFNFGQQYSDMEYKTFRERLRDSLANAFTRAPTPSSSEVPVWPPGPGRKYGSMT